MTALKLSRVALGLAAATCVASIGLSNLAASAEAPGATATGLVADGTQIVGMRRLTEAQYRQTIADIFGPDVKVAGRFEPIVRPVHELIASGARDAAISPVGLEQFDAMARNIAGQVFDEKHRQQFLPCKPADPTKSDSACARATLEPLGRLLFRRPLRQLETAVFVRMADDAASGAGSFYDGLQLALSAMLISPNFLYVIETARPDPASPGNLALDDYSRASRLSFSLWNSTPNKVLLDAAASGKLSTPEELAAISDKMVNSPRFEDGVRAFFADMLLFERFDELSKDPLIYPYFNSQVAKAMPEQMLRTIVDHVIARDGDYRELFTTNRTFMTRALGGLYQVPVTKAQGWQPYQFPATDDRAGILGQAGFLAIYSQSGRSSPTLRGRAIRELLMCQPVPNPPGNVNFTAVQDTANKSVPTARIRLNAHMTDENCAGCHKLTDPLGLSLERFDGIGSFRTEENDTPIDPAGELDGAKFTGAAGLGQVLAQSPDTTMCMASRALEYMRGVPSDDDGDMVEALEKGFAAQHYRVRELFRQVASDPATYRVKVPMLAPQTHVSLLSR